MMKDFLNMQILKNSKKIKHRKIYEKIAKIIEHNLKQEYLTEDEIIEIANKYPTLNVSVMVNNIVAVRSRKDNWLIIDEGRFYILYHKSLVIRHGKFREKYHIQDVFYDIEYVFASIVSHDIYAINGIRNTNKDIAELINKSN